MEYNQNGNYIVLAGMAVTFLGKFGVTTDKETIFLIVGGILSAIGVIKQFIAHKKLAKSAGAYPHR